MLHRVVYIITRNKKRIKESIQVVVEAGGSFLRAVEKIHSAHDAAIEIIEVYKIVKGEDGKTKEEKVA